MDISINMKKTGAQIKRFIKESGYTIRDIIEITGVSTEQTIYKWYSGKSIPSLENLLILCKLLGLQITELLALDEKFDLSDDHYLQDNPIIYEKNALINRQHLIESRSRRLAAYYQLICTVAA